MSWTEQLFYACNVIRAEDYPTRTIEYSSEFEKKYKSVLRKKKIRGILD